MMSMQTLILLLSNIGNVVRRESSMWRALLGCVLGLLAVFIAFESYRLIDDQYRCFKDNQTLIEGYKNIRGQGISLSRNFKAAFG